MTRCTILLAGLIWIVARIAAAEQERVSLPAQLCGPLVGHVTTSEATIWMYAEGNPEIIVEFRETAKPSDREIAIPVPGKPREFRRATADKPERVHAIRPKADPAQHNAIKAKLSGLKPATTYRYQVALDDKRDPVWSGQFTTPVAAGNASRFRVAVTSCMEYQGTPVQSSWYLLLAEKPDLQLLLGDNVYANTTDREKLWAMHREQRRVVEFAAVLRNTPTYAMWDDHDYGPNNSDGTAPGKENSLQAFKELFANPGAGTPETPGAFCQFSWGDVDFFLLDGRYHRSPDEAPNDDQKRMLGDAQFKWLADGLRNSKARFKVLASGSTLMESQDDGWRIYDFDRKRLYETIMGQKVAGVIYLSGDIHRCQLDVRPASETGGYPLYEVTSSGIANSKTDGFAMLEFDTTAPDPTIRVKIIHGDATTRLDRTLRLSELRVPE